MLFFVHFENARYKIKEGVFWLPENKEEQFSGEISYSLKEGVQLRLFGTFKRNNDKKFLRPEIIHGNIQTGAITLYQNLEIKRGSDFNIIRTSRYFSSLLIIGGWFDNKQDLKFVNIYTSISLLDLWFNANRAITRKDNTISYKFPEVFI